MTSAPLRISSRTLRRISSGLSTMLSGRPGCGMKRCVRFPDASQPSPWPPVWLSIVSEICIRGPGIIPCSTAVFTPRSAPPASRMPVIPASSVAFRFLAAS